MLVVYETGWIAMTVALGHLPLHFALDQLFFCSGNCKRGVRRRPATVGTQFKISLGKYTLQILNFSNTKNHACFRWKTREYCDHSRVIHFPPVFRASYKRLALWTFWTLNPWIFVIALNCIQPARCSFKQSGEQKPPLCALH